MRDTVRTGSSLQRRQWVGLLFVLPVILGTLVFNVIPTAMSLGISLTSWDLLSAPEFIGLDNYINLLNDSFAWSAMRNTFGYVIGSIVLGIPASLALAMLVSKPVPGIKIFRLIYFIPVVTSTVAVALVWQWILNVRLGLLNSGLSLIGITGPSWLKDPSLAMFSIIIVGIWAGLGYNMMIFLAGLHSVPEELYDAAKIDGASGWQRFFSVTLPMLSPTTFFIFIITIINSFQVFDIVYIFTLETGAAGRLRTTDVWVFTLWQNAFSFNRMGYASAMAWVLFLFIGAVTFVQWRFSKRWVFYQ